MSVIGGFIDHYIKKYEFYVELGRICAQACETSMEQMGIRAIVTSRAKKPERLRNKLEKRNVAKRYHTFEDIYDDIADLSGVRIALYFPGDLAKVRQFIEANFIVKECRSFPEAEDQDDLHSTEYVKRFSGYWATHYRVYMKYENLSHENKKYAKTMIEIQVASAIMHAWAEVEHDLVYKPFSGELSYEEYQILDELNGLVLTAEIALQRLQTAVKNRVSQVGSEFNNHYEVAIFLNNRFSSHENTNGELMLGRVDLLFNCIKSTDLNKPERIKELLSDVDPQRKDRSIVDQIMDKINEIDAALYAKYRDMKQSEELKHQMEALHMNRENGNRQGEANTLANIGYLYSSKENYEEALVNFEKAVQINHEIGSLQGEANQLLNLGSTYRWMGDMNNALEFCQRSVELHTKISYRQGQANAYSVMGNIYLDGNDYTKAFDHFQKALAIYKEADYKIGIITQLNQIGVLYMKQKKYSNAMQQFEDALNASIDSEYKQGEGDAMYNMGNACIEMDDTGKALSFLLKASIIHANAGNQKSRILVLIRTGFLYEKMNEAEKAMTCYQEALTNSRNIEFKVGEEQAVSHIHHLDSVASAIKNDL